MGSVNTRAVVEHGLAVRRRDGEGRAEGEQNTEPHLELAWAKLMPDCLSSTSRPILRGCRACARSTLTHVSSRQSQRQTKRKRGRGRRKGMWRERVLPLRLPSPRGCESSALIR